ncbi:sigma-70 family RNA polymerase sigma factor [SAR92 clade bacterium H921]|nr:sigma-70 family RNA polymerase sigma factor [SAR92 clade bacterium H921]
MKPSSTLEVFVNIKARLSRFLVSMVPPRDVEDIIQETYVRMCKVENKTLIKDSESFMFRTARNLALDYLKRAETRLTSGVDDVDEILLEEYDPTFGQIASDEEFGLFCAAIRELPKQSQRAFILKKVYGYSLKEIMLEMDLGQPTVESHIVSATKKCVQYMRNHNVELSGKKVGSMRHQTVLSDAQLGAKK